MNWLVQVIFVYMVSRLLQKHHSDQHRGGHRQRHQCGAHQTGAGSRIASVGAAREVARSVFHFAVALVVHVVADVAQIFGRTEALRTDAAYAIMMDY